MVVCYTLMGRELWGSRSIGELTQRQAESIKSKRKVSNFGFELSSYVAVRVTVLLHSDLQCVMTHKQKHKCDVWLNVHRNSVWIRKTN